MNSKSNVKWTVFFCVHQIPASISEDEQVLCMNINCHQPQSRHTYNHQLFIYVRLWIFASKVFLK